ncbi:NAD-dependent succinate-semialdehyde dehydrogenase [Aliikangiella sp. G2MR2-5]|uniref:NAD-dependent succinate-semialdehyde dehydrogenase n=1 Tax=Aliikangiella sp. G2MR2-5 TaxID=2788943 RepID=UPI0018A8BA54|nr:NAD-dependent succinate-semialdehyde dehydrogenase [Aliikangiella sp. G2MR2-5]
MALHLNDSGLIKTRAYINGEWISSRNSISVRNPCDSSLIARVAKAGCFEAQHAIDSAYQALQPWQAKAAKERASILRKWFNLIMESQEDLAKILTAEQGKVLAEARAEIAYGASYVEWFAEEAKRIYGDTIPAPSSDKRVVCIKQPVGVVACITPWNFPNAMLTRKIAPALAAGCTVVCKPASETPLSALAIAELAHRAGIPKGVINIVVGNAHEIGRVLTKSPLVRKLTFTGSTEVGKSLVADCSTTLKKTSMELGGNAPFIVFPDADLKAAISGLMASKFRNSGQTCVCTNRVLVHEKIYEEFKQKLTSTIKENLVLGHGDREGVTNGPLISQTACETVDRIVQVSLAKGAKLELGGKPSRLGVCFYPPTVLSDVTNDMPAAREEVFGPLVSLIRFTSEEQAIAIANDTDVGLAAYFYTRDIGRVWRMGEALEYGIVGINEGIISNEMAPFGGIKESGHGREGSKYGLDDYLEIKYMCMGGIDD